MIQQLAFLMAVTLVGLGLGGLLRKRIDYRLVCVTAFPMGLLLYVLFAMGVACLGLSLTPPLLAAGFGVACVLLSILSFRSGPYSRQETQWLMVTVALHAATGFLAVWLNLSKVWGSDDWIMPLIGTAFAAPGGFDMDAGAALGWWGVFVPMVHAAAAALGPEDYCYAHQPMMFLSLVATLGYVSYQGLREFGVALRVAVLLSCLTVGAMGTTYLVVVHAFYLHTHLNSGLYLLLYFVALWQSLRKESGAWLVFGMLALIGFSLQRIEAPLFALICLALLLAQDEVADQHRRRFVVCHCLFMCLWHLRIAAVVGSGSNEMLREGPALTWRCALIVAASFAITPLFCLRQPHVRAIAKRLPGVALYTLATALFVFGILEPLHMATCLRFIIRNALNVHFWGVTLMALGVLMALVVGLRRGFPHESLFVQAILASLMLTYGLGFFRPPYRLGAFDSANRMIVHVLPLTFLFVTLKFGVGFSRAVDGSDEPR